MSEDDLERYSGENTSTSTNSTPYPASRLAPTIDLVNMAREISQASNMVTQQTSAKLRVIANQIKALQAEAHEIMETAQQDQVLHQAQCNFKKQAGNIYHLYRHPNGRNYFSMLGPDEWGGRPPHEFVGSYRLESDMSWTAAESIKPEDEDAMMIRRLLEKHGLE
ncbi:MAG: DUF2452 domain-containing protein [Gammaproteobacteria bacterium]|nr:DUF2452 domain-containing protein [Gammaproteobacteria bacterium]